MENTRDTYSVCPVCLKRIKAHHVLIDGKIYLQKECDEHGKFSTIIWRGHVDMDKWVGDEKEIGETENLNCPNSCGLCKDHKRSTCCVLLEITSKCNLKCPYCFADSHDEKDPTLEYIKGQLKSLVNPGKTLVQLSGGEPTVRDDLPLIVAAAKEVGCKYVQLNSNGIRLAEDKNYVKALAEAGLSFVFMKFDGTNDEIYRKLSGRNLFDIKKKAIANCSEYNIGVTLVPMLVPKVNTDNIGEIIRFGVENSPAVRGVHFQPASYFGRIPQEPTDDMRMTLDELMFEMNNQAGDLVRTENIAPSCCDHPLCGFHGDFVVMPEGKLVPLTKKPKNKVQCCSSENPADKNRAFVARRWLRQKTENKGRIIPKTADIGDMDYFINRVKSHGFTITAMVFQDKWNIDLERLRKCSLHVFKDDKFIPFCSYYLAERF